MSPTLTRRTALTGAAALSAAAHPLAASAGSPYSPAMQALLSYARSQNTTGFLILRDRRVVVEENWAAPSGPVFKAFASETTPEGALLEDVASQQKSWVSMLVAMAVDRKLLDVHQPVSDIIGAGWSKASAQQEQKIRLLDVLTMSSGLTEGFTFEAPVGTRFFYNTPVYAITKKVVEAAAKQPIEAVTQAWLTGPAGLSHTAWRARPQTAAFAAAANPTGLVTSPRDAAKFGQLVLDGGLTEDGRRLVSEASLADMFKRAPTNPSYGRLWWLNGGAYSIRPLATRTDGPLIPAAPSDLVAALGALDRKLYIVPSQKLIVVRMGAAAETGFDEQLWLRLSKAIV